MYKQLIDKIRGRLSAPLHVRRGLGWLCLFLCVQTYVSADTSFPSIPGGARGGSPTGALILRSPQDYQVYGISPNGEWATGVYVNMNNMGYGFRWNLLSGKVELLSGDLCLSEGTSISNDGVVAGMFDNTEATDNGAPAYTAGYWKDGEWHHLPNINNAPVHNSDQVGYANAISPDGTYIGGSYNDKNSRLIPVVWKNGEIAHAFTPESGYEGMIYAVSADGQRAAGWSTTPNSEQARVATLWEVGKGATLIMDERLSNAWCSARKFSPNGKWLLFWEGYYDTPADQITDPTASNMALRALYNVETGEKTDMPTITRDPYNFDVFDITDNGTIVGYESPETTQIDQAIIFKDGKTRWLYDYLQELGVDLDGDKNIMRQNGSTYFIRAVGISNDEKTFAVLYYDIQGALCSMIIKLDENLTTRPPVELEAKQLAGLNAVTLYWNIPLAGADGVTGYNLYRDNVKVNDAPLTALSCIDNEVADGGHSYHVTALYGDVESEASQAVALTVGKMAVQSPRNFFTRQMGYNGALLQWDVPRTNLTIKSYYPEGAVVSGFGGGNNSFEAAIRISADETALYVGQSIYSVGFYPMTPQEAWKVNVYKRSVGSSVRELVYTQPVTQPLSYGKENVVKLSTPVAIPAGSDLYVAVEVTVPSDYVGYNVLGEVSGDPIPGQTDLIRMVTEPDFYSLYEEGKKFGATQLTTWAISANLMTSGTDVSKIDEIDYYGIYDGTEEVGVAAGRLFLFNSLAAGVHELGVKAYYKDGRMSEIVSFPLVIEPDEKVYKSVSEVDVRYQDASTVEFAWNVPEDNDETFITHSTDALQGGVLGPSENNYNYIAAADYDPVKLQGYEGYYVTALRFMPLTQAVYTFFLEENGATVAELDVENYVAGQWNTVMLKKPVVIKVGATYRLLLDCYDVAPQTAPLGLDARMPFTEVGDLYSVNDGVTYASVSQASAFGNWMMGLVAVSPDSRPLPVEGYEVRIDNKKVNADLLAEPHFTWEFPEGDASHRINVDVCYEVKGVVKGNAVFFRVGPNALDETSMAVLHVSRGDNFVRVEGEGVESVSVFDHSGKFVSRIDGCEWNISSVPAGVYLLQVRVKGRVQTMKVQILRS